MGFLTSFFSGALDQANKGFDNAAKEQLRVNEATLKRQEVVDAEAAKQSANAKKVADLARALQSTGVEPDKAFAVARYPGAANMKPDELVELASRMQAIPGQMTPAETQTRTIISPARTINTPGIFTPPVKQPAITMTTGENQPPRQTYSITGVPREEIMKSIDKFPAAQNPEQAQAQQTVIEALRTNQLHTVTSEVLQRALAGQAKPSADQVGNQIADEYFRGAFKSEEDAVRAYFMRGGTNKDFNLHGMVLGGGKSDEASAREKTALMIFQGAKEDGHPITMGQARLIAAGGIKSGINTMTNEPYIANIPAMLSARGATPSVPTQPEASTTPTTTSPAPRPHQAIPEGTRVVVDAEGNPIRTGSPVLDRAPSYFRERAVLVPKAEVAKSQEAIRQYATSVDKLQYVIALVNGDKGSVGLEGNIREKMGMWVQFATVADKVLGHPELWSQSLDELFGATDATKVRNELRNIELTIGRPLLQDRTVNKDEQALVREIIGGLHTSTSFKATVAGLNNLLNMHYALAARNIKDIPQLAPPDNLGFTWNKDVTQEYGRTIMALGFDFTSAGEILKRLQRMQNGKQLTVIEK